MPKLIHKGVVMADQRPLDHIKTVDQWLDLPDKKGSPVRLNQDESPAPLFDMLSTIELIIIDFTSFMDGRGFSHARDLRERGYTGELRASGNFIVDQLHYLQRCGFDSFELGDTVDLEDALSQLKVFDEHYQGAIDEPQPLFKRRRA